MSMSEFDEQMNREESCSSPISISGHSVPDDFSEEDMAFALELESLFDVEQENLPPYFVQTLMDAENPRFQPAEKGFEHKIRARVFRRLKLKRKLFVHTRLSPDSLFAALPARRPLMAFSMALMLFMLLTVLVTGPSFADGLEILLSGGKVGTVMVHSLPHNTLTVGNAVLGDIASPDSDANQLPLSAASLKLPFPPYLSSAVPDSYSVNAIFLYQGVQQQWVDGPIIVFKYMLPARMIRHTGILTIGEFKLDPSVKVLQVVKDGAAEPVGVAQNGQPTAIFVDGQWVLHNNDHADWVYGQRSELIYQRDGVVFWLVGDQIDGMDEGTLLSIANSLQPMDISSIMQHGLSSQLDDVTIPDSTSAGPFSGDVLAVYSGDAPIGPYLNFVGADTSQSPQPAPTKPAYLRPDVRR